jgi:beta-glucanase (GH16 family)
MRTRPSIRVVMLAALLPLVLVACDSHPAGYELVFSDEFDGTQLDRSAWCTRYIYGGGPAPQPDPQCQRNGDGNLDFLNDEQQRYVDTNRNGEQMHVLRDGVLSLRATRTRNDPYASYESAMIRSKATFRPTGSTSYYITARVRLPDVRGTWPALWLNSDRRADGTTTWPPEIDIFEGPLNLRDDTAEMLHQATIIRGAQTASRGREYTFTAPEFETTWNNYRAAHSLRARWIEVSAEWTASGVCYFVDGYKTACENYRWVYDGGEQAAPAHILLNLAIGGGWAGRDGIDTARFPTSLDVDWVRVYRKG